MPIIQLPLFPDTSFAEDGVAAANILKSGRALRILGIGDAQMCELAPGQFAAQLHTDQLPAFGVYRCKYIEKGPLTGMIQPQIGVYPDMIPIEGMREFFPSISYPVMRRLFMAGFIQGVKITNDRILLSVPSLLRHLQVTRINAEEQFWTEARIQRYQSVRE